MDIIDKRRDDLFFIVDISRVPSTAYAHIADVASTDDSKVS